MSRPQTASENLKMKGKGKKLEDYVRLNQEGLIDLDRSRRGQTETGCLVGLFGILSMPVCAYVGSYIGEGIGWLGGNIIDYIPLVRNVAPWMAERAGLIENAKTAVDLNENLYQTTGAIGGFWGGLFLPIKIMTQVFEDK